MKPEFLEESSSKIFDIITVFIEAELASTLLGRLLTATLVKNGNKNLLQLIFVAPPLYRMLLSSH